MKRQLNSVSPHQRCFFSSFLSSHSCNYNETSTKKDCGKTGTENENGGLEVCWYLPPVFLTCWVKKKRGTFQLHFIYTHTWLLSEPSGDQRPWPQSSNPAQGKMLPHFLKYPKGAQMFSARWSGCNRTVWPECVFLPANIQTVQKTSI